MYFKRLERRIAVSKVDVQKRTSFIRPSMVHET